jgi:transcriptional repressor of dcmA and dcmR
MRTQRSDNSAEAGQKDFPDLLTIKQAARLLNVSEVSLRRWTNSGRLPCVRVGAHRARRFRREDLFAFLEQESAHAGASESAGLGGEIRRTQVLLGGIAIDYGSHLCALYDSAAGREKLSVPLLTDGLRQGDNCFLVASPRVQEELLEHLRDVGCDVGAALETGRLVVTSGKSSGPAMLDYLHEQFTLATRAGAQSMRLVGDMGWTMAQGWELSELTGYELAYNNSLGHQYPIVSLCQYDARMFSGTGVLGALRCHEDTFRYPLARFLGTSVGNTRGDAMPGGARRYTAESVDAR